MSRKLTTDEFKQIVTELSNGTIEFIDEYQTTHTKSKFKCNKGHTFMMTPNRFKCGDRCPKCSGKYKPTTDEFQKEIDEIYGKNKYILLEEYKNNSTSIKIKCNNCGEIFLSKRDYIINNKIKTLCPKCRNRKNEKYTNEEYLDKFNIIHKNDELELLENYNDTNDNSILVKCNKCNYVWKANKFWLIKNKNYTGCPSCTNSSKIEIKIRKYLRKKKILFDEQKIFYDLKIDNFLKFDFCIYIKNRFALIEYDGEMHDLKNVNSMFNKDKKNSIEIRDKFKDEYCTKHKMKLFRISYKDLKDNSLENILDDILNKI